MYKEKKKFPKIPPSENWQFSSLPKMDGKFGLVVITMVKMSTGVVCWSVSFTSKRENEYLGGTRIRGVLRSGLYGTYIPTWYLSTSEVLPIGSTYTTSTFLRGRYSYNPRNIEKKVQDIFWERPEKWRTNWAVSRKPVFKKILAKPRCCNCGVFRVFFLRPFEVFLSLPRERMKTWGVLRSRG
jgi:hypothetical protein